MKKTTLVDAYTSFIASELRTRSDGVRIVYENDARFVQKLIPSQIVNSFNGSRYEFNQSDVILITGGGNGITSRIAVEVASKIPAKYVIIGRSELSTDDYTTDKWDSRNFDDRRAEVKELLSRSGKRVTPVLIDDAIANALKQRELQCTIKKIKELGRELIYQNCDITCSDQLTTCIENVTAKWGKITGIIHGAGFEKSQLLSKKDRKEFFSVVDVKVLGALQLLELCPVEHLKLWVSMSSISGVFGNEAQTDYSSANAFLNGLAEDIATENAQSTSLALAWSGWSDLGMAWRNTFVRQNAQSMGLFLIPPSEGAAAAVNTISGGSTYPVYILHCGLGSMVTSDWKPELLFDVPLLENVEIVDSNILRAFKTVSVETDEWINQHRLEDVPLAPGVGMMEIMAETFAQTSKIEKGVKFENLKFLDAFKLYKGKPRQITVEANGIFKNSQKMQILSEFSNKLIKTPDIREYCSSVVSTVNEDAPRFELDQWKIQNPQKMFYEEMLKKLNSIQHNVIFGPLFHDSKRSGYVEHSNYVEWNAERIHTIHSFPMEQLINKKYKLEKYLFNFCLLDSIHQTGVIHTILASGNVHLPFSAREFLVFGKQQTPGSYHTFAKLVNKTDNTFVYDIYLIDPENNICACALGSTYHRING